MRKEEPKVSSYVKPILIIGSSSVWRKAIIEENFGTLFTLQCVSPGIDEKAIRDSNAESLVQKLSRAKLEAVRSKVFAELSRCPTTASELYVVCGDQVVRFESMIREKPVSKEENVAFLKSYRNKCIETVTCLAVERIEVPASGEGIFLNEASRDQGSGPPHSVCALDVQIDCVHFGDIPDSVIDQVVAKGESMQTCGGIVIEDPLLAPYITLGTSRTTGCAAMVPSDKSQQRYAVMGFPVDMFRRLVGKVHCDNRGDVDHL